MIRRYLVISAAEVGHLYFGPDLYIALNVYRREAAKVGAVVVLYEVAGQDKKLLLEKPVPARTQPKGGSSINRCSRCGAGIESDLAPAVDVLDRPVCEECSEAEHERAWETWLRAQNVDHVAAPLMDRFTTAAEGLRFEDPDLVRKLKDGLFHTFMSRHSVGSHPICEECMSAALALAKSGMR